MPLLVVGDHAVAPSRRARRIGSVLGAALIIVLVASGCIFDGTWTPTPAAVLPVQGLATQLDDVSCVSEDWCMAVGGFGWYPLVQVWDGTEWSVVSAPPLAPQANAHLTSVDCGSPTACLAKVTRMPEEPSDFEYLVAWDGTHWHEVPPGGTTDGAFIDPTPYSCAPDGTCVVVIQTNDVTVEWDGVQFTSNPYSSAPLASLGDVYALDCLSATACVAAFFDGLATWNGSSWSAGTGGVTGAFPDAFYDGADDIACTSTSDCVAFGRRYPNGVAAAHWDGTSWNEVALPAGWTGATEVSCVGAGACLVLGHKGSTSAMAAWSGGAWYDAPAPPAGTNGISCVPRWCVADAGNDGSGRPQPATYTWTDA